MELGPVVRRMKRDDQRSRLHVQPVDETVQNFDRFDRAAKHAPQLEAIGSCSYKRPMEIDRCTVAFPDPRARPRRPVGRPLAEHSTMVVSEAAQDVFGCSAARCLDEQISIGVTPDFRVGVEVVRHHRSSKHDRRDSGCTESSHGLKSRRVRKKGVTCCDQGCCGELMRALNVLHNRIMPRYPCTRRAKN
jgi:hypothetical protein